MARQDLRKRMMPEVSITGDLNTETTPSRCELLELARVTREQRFGFAFRDFYRTHKTASQQPGASPPGGWGDTSPPVGETGGYPPL